MTFIKANLLNQKAVMNRNKNCVIWSNYWKNNLKFKKWHCKKKIKISYKKQKIFNNKRPKRIQVLNN